MESQEINAGTQFADAAENPKSSSQRPREGQEKSGLVLKFLSFSRIPSITSLNVTFILSLLCYCHFLNIVLPARVP